MNRIWCLLLLFTLFCQRNTPDADELLPVTSAAVWREGDGYHLLLEGARQSSLDGDAAPVYLSASARDMDNLFEEAQAAYADRLTFMHVSLVLIDRTLDRDDLASLCGVLLDDQGAPRTCYLAFAAGDGAETLLRHEHPVEEIPGLGLRDLLHGREISEGVEIATLQDGKFSSDYDKLSTLQSLFISKDDQVVCGKLLNFDGKANPLTKGGVL